MGTSGALTPLGLMEARASSRWRLVEHVVEDDLDRRLNFLPSLAFLAGLLAGGGDFGIANSKPTLGSELTDGDDVADEPVLVPATVGVVQVAPSVDHAGASAGSVYTIESDVDNAGASAGTIGTIEG